MSGTIHHRFVSPKADGSDATLLRPSKWNDSLVMADGSAGDVPTRDLSVTDGWSWIAPMAINVTASPYLAAGNGVTDATAALQAALDAAKATGRALYVPTGTYVVTASLTFNTTGETRALRLFGDGMYATIFDNRVASGALCSLNGNGSANTYAKGLHLSDFGIITTTAPAVSRGIDLKSQWYGRIERVRIIGLSSDAIRITCTGQPAGDADASNYLVFENVTALSCGGWGLHMPNPTGASGASGAVTLTNCVLDRNALGGARVFGLNFRFAHSYFGDAGAGGGSAIGILIPSFATQAVECVVVESCEFQNTSSYFIDAQAVSRMRIRDCKFIIDASVPTVGIRAGDGNGTTTATNVVIENPQLRNAGGPTHTFVAFGTNAVNGRLDNLTSSTSTGLTVRTDAGTNTLELRNNRVVAPKAQAGTTVVAGGGTYTPDMATRTCHRIQTSSAGALTVANPIFTGGTIVEGMEMEIAIVNGSGGVTTATFGAAFLHAGYGDPAAGLSRTCRFRYDANSAGWRMVGAWSPSH